MGYTSLINGYLLLSIFKGNNVDVDMTQIKSIGEQYYSFDDMIKVLNTFDCDSLIKIGKYIPFLAIFPDHLNTFHEALEKLDIAHKMNLLITEDIGSYQVEKVSMNRYKVQCVVPYPSKFNYGLLLGLAERFGVMIDIDEMDQDNGGIFEVTILN